MLRIGTLLLIVIAFAGSANAQCTATFSAGATYSPAITTPNWPNNYPNNLQCTWIVHSSVAGRQVQVQFSAVATEICCDVAEIRDGGSSSGQILHTLRGNVLSTFLIASNFGSLYITFVSDHSVTAKGFRFQYKLGKNAIFY
ncbi:tolloid-like protein 1 [Ciona intestinalis]